MSKCDPSEAIRARIDASSSWRMRLMRLIVECLTFGGQSEQRALDALEAALCVMGDPR